MDESILDEVSGLDLGLRSTVALIQAGIEYHVNRIMLEEFGTDSFESERMNSKLMALNDVGIIDDTLRQDLIQISRIRHVFAHRLDVDEAEFVKLLGEISRGEDSGSTMREKFLAAARQSFEMIRQIQEDRSGLPLSQNC